MSHSMSKEDVIKRVREAGKLEEFERDWARPLDVYLDEYKHIEDIGERVLGDLGISFQKKRDKTSHAPSAETSRGSSTSSVFEGIARGNVTA